MIQVQQVRRSRLKFWLILGGIIGVVIVALLLVSALVIYGLIAELSGYNKEFGYRSDVDPQIYQDMAANRGNFTVGSDYPDFSSTVSVSNFGSGVVIAPTWVLTAGHVLLDPEYGEEQADDLVIYIGLDYENPDNSYSVKSIHIHPAWRADNSDLGLEHGMDIALIELDEPITEVTPALWANSTNLDIEMLDTVVYTAGFGDYTLHLNDNNGEWWSQKRAWSNVLDRVNGGIDGTKKFEGDETMKGGFVVYDFDSPEENENSLGDDGWWLGNDYEYGGVKEGDSDGTPLQYEGTSVPGDSGGPTYGYQNGEWWVIGVTSHGSTDGHYGDIAFNTRVASSSVWICSVATDISQCE